MVDSTPAEPLPRLDSMRSGASSELRNWLPFCAIWVKDLRSKLMVTPVSFSNISAAFFQAWVCPASSSS